mmetsp:Transcript_25261/g.30539  ORF Transcript_25261/g.30539 Transcript_25261/m.30539 type:complete len:223 (-) Transcript_25261:154-822(-)|eukprot:CAMPEP_0172502992 /NCGR_PEP_ID=MMETSP1066-20121228/164825_1 /TAXON_ID=671091 /ORGANISM="Coscinodiscus wailesii, Strain CCMP2513" /LENGTH=222 /DNA_ID=CAMNT_0013278505 /DNA_START=155 /DNA_END=823 /DNA_ORIENTATION=+
MGRYTTVQAYGDNNPSMRNVPYQQATGSTETKKGVVKTEKVNNPYGSTAGAGSGEFHVYRHARLREMNRLKDLDREEEEKALEDEYRSTVDKYKTEEEKKTEKRRKKRQRGKAAKMRKKNLKEMGVDTGNGSKNELDEAEEDEDEEFEYVPIKRAEDDETKEENLAQPIQIPNDGSFLEMMKKRLAENQEQKNNIITSHETSDGNENCPRSGDKSEENTNTI